MHRLALALGRTVAELGRTMGAREYADWLAYYAVEPWGAHRDNLHAGMIAAAVYNAAPNASGRPRRAMAPKDFLLREADEAKQEQTARTLAHLRAIGTRKPKRKNVNRSR